MKIKILGLVAIGFLLSSGECGPEYEDNTRIYVEGKTNVGNVPVILQRSIFFVVSKSTTKSDGSFGLGGPGITDSVEVTFNRKIKSFSTGTLGCKLSYDSMEIILPEKITYVKFNQIELE
ncbi:MAG: hypothetical protein LBE36_12790 [Flavobacteriaceae bacterium]|jgi:hypothetical protein|nr:hypothetical protein [Flavobacteriaceae bacterium]